MDMCGMRTAATGPLLYLLVRVLKLDSLQVPKAKDLSYVGRLTPGKGQLNFLQKVDAQVIATSMNSGIWLEPAQNTAKDAQLPPSPQPCAA